MKKYELIDCRGDSVKKAEFDTFEDLRIFAEKIGAIKANSNEFADGVLAVLHQKKKDA